MVEIAGHEVRVADADAFGAWIWEVVEPEASGQTVHPDGSITYNGTEEMLNNLFVIGLVQVKDGTVVDVDTKEPVPGIEVVEPPDA